MRPLNSRRLRRFVVPALAACSLSAAAAAPASAASPCAAGTSARATTLCLVNAERAAHGVRPLKLDKRLSRAALRHSRDMVAKRYFAHDSRSGAGFSARIARTGWMHGRRSWNVGENIAWGSGALATPRAIVKAWMRSTGHRHNIMQPRFRVIGIGIGHGVPVSNGGAGATYTTDFGS